MTLLCNVERVPTVTLFIPMSTFGVLFSKGKVGLPRFKNINIYQMQCQFLQFCNFMSRVEDVWVHFNKCNFQESSKGKWKRLGGHFFTLGQWYGHPCTMPYTLANCLGKPPPPSLIVLRYLVMVSKSVYTRAPRFC